jgi:putative ABC transport system substrate-binding protein
MPVIGVLSARAAETDTALLGFFREGLRQSGYLEGHNVAVEYRWPQVSMTVSLHWQRN